MLSPPSQPQNQYRASTPLPRRHNKRDSTEAGNDDIEVRITKPKSILPAKRLSNNIHTPSDRPTKKVKLSHELQPDTLSEAPPLCQPQHIPPFQQGCQMSAMQQDILQRLPPSQLLMNAAVYLCKPKPLLPPPPSVGSKRAWVEAVKDDGWGSYELVGPMLKRPRLEIGLRIPG